MEILDYAYLNDLVSKSQRGSSNAFAELFAATFQRQYAYSCRCLRDLQKMEAEQGPRSVKEPAVAAEVRPKSVKEPAVTAEVRPKSVKEPAETMESRARAVLQETYIRALKGIGRLQSPDLFIAWLCRINFRVCLETLKNPDQNPDIAGRQRQEMEDRMLEVDRRNYSLRQILNLPLVESQTVLMKYYQKMTAEEIGDTMNTSRSSVRRTLRAGRKHLQKIEF